MGFKKKPIHLPEEKRQQIQKVISTLKIGGRSEATMQWSSFSSAIINPFQYAIYITYKFILE